MDHGGGDEGDGVGAEAEGVPLLDLDELLVVHGEAELPHEHEGLGGGDDLHVGPADEDLLDGRAVVGFHVVDDQVVQGPVPQQVVQVFHELAADGPVHGVEQDGGFVHEQVGVVAHPPGDGVNVFKQMGAVVVGAHPVQVVGDGADTVHIEIPPLG